jgi:hypothetical protein
MLAVIGGIVIIIICIIVVSLCIGLTFKQFIEVAVATATIGGAIIVLIGFYYKSKEKKIESSMDRVITTLDLMSQTESLNCVWSEIEGTSSLPCVLDMKSRLIILRILKEMDAAIYTDRTDLSIDFIIERLFKSPTIKDEYMRNRYLFSLKFNNYVQRVL